MRTHPGGSAPAQRYAKSKKPLVSIFCAWDSIRKKVTMRYAHLSPQAMLEAVNLVGNVVAGARVGRTVAATV